MKKILQFSKTLILYLFQYNLSIICREVNIICGDVYKHGGMVVPKVTNANFL